LLRYALVALQVVLVGISLYFLHNIARALIRSAPVPEARIPPPEPVPERDLSYARYASIVKRNLFNSRSFQPAALTAAPEPEEDLDESKLRVQLIGTAATQPEALSVAAVLDESTNERMVVRKGDMVAGARVERIERKRIVVNNRGKREAISLDEEARAAPAPPPRRPGVRARPRARGRTPSGSLAGRVRQLAQKAEEASSGRAPTPRSAGPVSILTQARMLPSYDEDGELRGLKLSGIKAGSQLQAAGFQEGDVVRSVNGTEIASPAQGLRILREIDASEAVEVEVERAGELMALEYSPEAE
jgi:type II secretion system protein C